MDSCREEAYEIDPYNSTLANQYGSLTSVNTKKHFFNIRRSNEKSIDEEENKLPNCCRKADAENLI